MLRRTIPALPFHIVLLLVALFNALAGAPLHEARHIQEVVRSATALAAAGDVDALATRSAASDDHSADPFTAQQVRWPFAARDPPPAQRA